jgi:hypothetical protein
VVREKLAKVNTARSPLQQKDNHMNHKDISQPVYTFQPITNIQLFGNIEVPKPFYDFVWGQAGRHISKMGTDSDVSVNEILDVDIHGLLSEEGIHLAEACLDHFAAMKYLPLTVVGQDSKGRTEFTVD